MVPPPCEIHGAKVVCFTPIDERHRPTGSCRHIVGSRLEASATGLAICRYSGEACYYLFGCDSCWNCVTDTWHATIEDAKAQAEFEYAGVSALGRNLTTKMEKPMKTPNLPKTDSIHALAEFWDTHDLTDFEDEMEEVAEPVFVRDTPIKVHLESSEAEAVQQLAQAKGISQEALVRQWVLQRLARWKGGRPKKRCS